MLSYLKRKSISCKHSASLLLNNLAVLPVLESSIVRYAVVHKSLVDVVTASLDGSMVTSRQVSLKNHSAAESSAAVSQAKWVTPGIKRTLLVLTSQRGIQMFEPDGSALVFFYSLIGDGNVEEDSTSMYARGIAAVGNSFVCVGTHTGSILPFKVPLKGSDIVTAGQLLEHEYGICDLAAEDKTMVSSDIYGNIIIWLLSEIEKFTSILKIPGVGSPCNSIALWRNTIIGGYGSGILQVFCAKTGALAAEATAHCRWINSVDVAKDTGLVLSASEDSFIRIWQVKEGPFPEIEYRTSECITNNQLVGAKFVHDSGKAICVTGYDNCEIMFLVSK